MEFGKPKIKLNLKKDIEEIKKSSSYLDLIKFNFVKTVCLAFYNRKKQLKIILTREDAAKNHAVAKSYFDKFQFNIKEIIDTDGLKSEEILELQKRLLNPQLWKEVIDYLFDNLAVEENSWYVQTVGGAFKYYLKGKYNIKQATKRYSSEDYALLKELQSWKTQQIVDLFHFYVCRVYRTLYPEQAYEYKKLFYSYTKFVSLHEDRIPRIKSIVVLKLPLLRGLLLSLEDKFKEWQQFLEFDYTMFIDYKKLQEISNEYGAEFLESIVNKDLNDLIADSMDKFCKMKDAEA